MASDCVICSGGHPVPGVLSQINLAKSGKIWPICQPSRANEHKTPTLRWRCVCCGIAETRTWHSTLGETGKQSIPTTFHCLHSHRTFPAEEGGRSDTDCCCLTSLISLDLSLQRTGPAQLIPLGIRLYNRRCTEIKQRSEELNYSEQPLARKVF